MICKKASGSTRIRLHGKMVTPWWSDMKSATICRFVNYVKKGKEDKKEEDGMIFNLVIKI